MKRTLTLLTAFLLAVPMTACSTKKEEEKPQTLEQTSEENYTANDFDTQDHYTAALGDYTFEIPDNYRNKQPNYFIENTSPDQIASLLLHKDDTVVVPSYELLAFGIDTYINGVMEGFEDAKLIEKGETNINGIPMSTFTITGITSGVDGILHAYVFVNPSDHVVLGAFFVQSTGAKYDHFADFDKIVGSIKPAE